MNEFVLRLVKSERWWKVKVSTKKKAITLRNETVDELWKTGKFELINSNFAFLLLLLSVSCLQIVSKLNRLQKKQCRELQILCKSSISHHYTGRRHRNISHKNHRSTTACMILIVKNVHICPTTTFIDITRLWQCKRERHTNESV